MERNGDAGFVKPNLLTSSFVRVMLLNFLELVTRTHTSGSPSMASSSPSIGAPLAWVEELAIALLDVNFDPDTPPNAMENSRAFGRRLRSWQALCVIVPLIPFSALGAVNDRYWRALQHLNVHTIRFYMDLFGMLLCR